MSSSNYFPTKYDSARDEVIALLSDEAAGYGMRDDSAGDSEAPTGYFALVTIPTDVDLSQREGWRDVWIADTASAYGVTADDVRGSHIVTHDSQGFVSVETFDSESEARAAFTCREARYAEWVGHEDECPTMCADDNGEWNGCEWDGVYVCPVPGHGYHSI